jgi:hypothetical protein
MLTNMEILFVTALSILGALASAGLGWCESGESFVARKFASSMMRALFAGALSALGFSTVQSITPWDYIIAALSGAGIDVIGSRAAGAVAARAVARVNNGSTVPPSPTPAPTEDFLGDYQGWDVYIRQNRLIVFPPANLTANLGAKMEVGGTEGYAKGTDFMAMARTFIDQQLAIINAPDYGKTKTPPGTGI